MENNTQENIYLTKSYLEYKPNVPLWCILIQFAHAIGLYFLWSHMENIIDDLPEMLVYAWDSSGQYALAWHSSLYLDNMVYAAILVMGIGTILTLFFRFVPLLLKVKHPIKDQIYRYAYYLFTFLPLVFTGLIVYMFFMAVACKRYNMFLVCGLALIILVYFIVTLVKTIKLYKHNMIKKAE